MLHEAFAETAKPRRQSGSNITSRSESVIDNPKHRPEYRNIQGVLSIWYLSGMRFSFSSKFQVFCGDLRCIPLQLFVCFPTNVDVVPRLAGGLQNLNQSMKLPGHC